MRELTYSAFVAITLFDFAFPLAQELEEIGFSQDSEFNIYDLIVSY